MRRLLLLIALITFIITTNGATKKLTCDKDCFDTLQKCTKACNQGSTTCQTTCYDEYVRCTSTCIYADLGGSAQTEVQAFGLAAEEENGCSCSTIYSWGHNGYGELATGDDVLLPGGTPCNSPRPQPAPSAFNPPLIGVTFTQVSAHSTGIHSLALTSDGDVYAWGWGGYGQLGTQTMQSITPLKVNNFPLANGVKITQVSAGGFHSLALASDGTVFEFGLDNQISPASGPYQGFSIPEVVNFPLANGVKIIQVSAGGRHSLALADDGVVWVWGNNQYCQLGNPTFACDPAVTTLSTGPVQVVFQPPLPSGVTIDHVEAGGFHSLAIGSDNRVYAWGLNRWGELGDPTLPVSWGVNHAVKADINIDIIQVAAGYQHSFALAYDGTLFAWGLNNYQQLGIGSVDFYQGIPTPTELKSSFSIKKVAAGWSHSLALTTDGRVYAWGRNENGAIGIGACCIGEYAEGYALLPVPALTSVAAGNSFSSAV